MLRGVSFKGALSHLVEMSGVCAITYGAWLVYEPAGFIVGGAFAVIAAAAVMR